MAESEPGRRTEPEAAEATRLGREFAQLFDDVIEAALGELFSAVGESGLGFAELRVLRALAEGSSPPSRDGRPLKHADLACATGLSIASVRGALVALESRGLVASPAEGAAALTNRGRTLLGDLRNRRQAALTAFVRSRDLGERLRLAGALHLARPSASCARALASFRSTPSSPATSS